MSGIVSINASDIYIIVIGNWLNTSLNGLGHEAVELTNEDIALLFECNKLLLSFLLTAHNRESRYRDDSLVFKL